MCKSSLFLTVLLLLSLLLNQVQAAVFQESEVVQKQDESLSAQDWAEIIKLLASDGETSDNFGVSVSINGDTLVVGSSRNDDNGMDSGSTYIFERNQDGTNNWGEVKKLLASDGDANDNFGISVSINGDTLVVGAYFDDDNGNDSGSAYIFERNQGGTNNWGEVKKLTASDGMRYDFFGEFVSISGDTVVVGAHGDDDNGSVSGSAYIFERNQGGTNNWGEVKKLLASDGEVDDRFGRSVSIYGSTVIVGAYFDDDNGLYSGSAYIFERNQGGTNNWGEVKKLLASDGAASDRFGISVSISGDTVVVGAKDDDDNGNDSGSAYIFERNQGGTNNWGEVKKLLASDNAAGDRFGKSVSISGNTVVVGANFDDANGGDSGSAYIFERNQNGTNNWGEVQKLLASDGETDDNFGWSTSISGDTVVIGAYGDDDNGDYSGSAYVFQSEPSSELPSDQELAQKYAPYLYRHQHETYWPISLEPVVGASVLYYPGGSVALSDPDQLANAPYNDPTSYLDLPGESKEDLATYFQSVWNEPEWQPQAYARVYKDPVNPENVVIQYWLYYWDNPGLNHHEGDLEMIQVVLESGVPKYAVFSQHDVEGKRFWQDVDTVDGTHPVVYVARGSHASYFKPYRHWVDSTGTTAMRSSQPISFTMLSTDTAWLDFEGYWGKGKNDAILWNDGPRGPKFQGRGTKWSNPIIYTQVATWDELNPFSQIGKFRVSIDSTDNPPTNNDVHVYKRTPGEDPHVGWNNGVVEIGIEDAEYFDNSEAMSRTIILHNVMSKSLFYRVETQYRPSGQALHQLATIKTTGTLNLTLNYPDPEAGAVITSTYAVSRAWGVSSTTFISVHHGSDLYLNMDLDGDGVFEESVPPTTLEQNPYDFTAPAPITDLAILTSTNDSVVLTWTATGDDGNIGTASGYDIRYYTNPLTNSNWVSATMVNSPVPSIAGTTETITVTNMPPGEFYFALQSFDDMFYYSDFSNVVQAEIPNRYIYLPLVLRHN